MFWRAVSAISITLTLGGLFLWHAASSELDEISGWTFDQEEDWFA